MTEVLPPAPTTTYHRYHPLRLPPTTTHHYYYYYPPLLPPTTTRNHPSPLPPLLSTTTTAYNHYHPPLPPLTTAITHHHCSYAQSKSNSSTCDFNYYIKLLSRSLSQNVTGQPLRLHVGLLFKSYLLSSSIIKSLRELRYQLHR